MVSNGKTFRKAVLGAASCVLLALAAAGCGGGGEAGGGSKASNKGGGEGKSASAGPVAIEFWHAMSGEHMATMEEMVGEFNKANPDVKVTAIYQGNYNALKLKLTNSLVTSEPPALAQVYEGWTTSFMDKGHIAYVQDFVDEEEDGFKETLGDIYPGFLEDNTWDGDLITLPFNKSTYVVFYNADKLKEGGYDKFPDTMEGVLEAAGKLTESEGDQKTYGIGVRTTLEPFSTLMHAMGGRFHQVDGNNVVAVNTPASRKALATLAKLNAEGSAYLDGGYMSSAFGAETIAFFWGSSAGLPFVAKGAEGKFSWGAASLPDGSGDGTGRHLFQGTNIAIFKKAGEPETQAAWRFLKFLMSPANTAKWAARTGYLPVRRAALKEKAMTDFIAANPAYKVCLGQLETAVFEPKKAYWDQVRNEIASDIESALQGRKTVEEALEAAEQKAQRIIRDDG